MKWVNNETRIVGQWILNRNETDEDWYENAREIGHFYTENTSGDQLAAMLKIYYNFNSPEYYGLPHEICKHFLASVDWQEIAQRLLEQVV